MKAIVGLGNPELKYDQTRHNAGFWVVNALSTISGANFDSKKNLYCDLAKVKLEEQDILLVKPNTYMNESGKSISAILNWYKLSSAEILIVHDDVSLPLGKIRMQKGGGAGGQHGMESIIEYLGGNKSCDRLKFGIGPDPGGERRADYVLSTIPASDHELVKKVIGLSTDAVCTWLKHGIQEAMNKYNGIVIG